MAPNYKAEKRKEANRISHLVSEKIKKLQIKQREERRMNQLEVQKDEEEKNLQETTSVK
jgi:hypothetical protein